MQLIKIYALFHFAQRPTCIFKMIGEEETYILATAKDYAVIMGLWHHIRETTETFSSGQIMNFYHEIVENMKKDRFLINDLVEKWNQKFEQKKGSRTIRKWVSFLCEINYMTKMSNPSDRRSNLFEVIEQKNSEHGLFELAAFFTLDSLKEWLNKARNIIPPTAFITRDKMFSNEITLEQLYQKYFSFTPPSGGIIFSKKKPASLTERTEEKTAKTKIPHYPLFTVNEVLKLERLITHIEDKCVCGFKGRMDWQVALHNQKWNMLCDKCGLKLDKQLREG